MVCFFKKTGFGIFISICFLCATSVMAEEFSIQEAFDQALNLNPTYLAQKEVVAQTKAEQQARRGAFLPEIDALGTLVLEDERKFDGGPTVKTKPRSAALKVRQNLFAGGENIARVAEAKRQFYAAQAALNNSEQDVLLDSAQAFLDVLLAREVLRLNTFQVEVLTKHAEASQKRFELSEITKTDVAQAQARLAQAQANETSAQGEVQTKEAVFQEVIGIAAPKKIKWPTGDVLNDEDDFPHLEEKAYAQHPKITEAVALLAAEKQALKAAKADYWPDVNAEVSFARREGGFSVLGNGDSDEFNATLNATFPLFRGGATRSLVKKAKAREREAYAHYIRNRREVKRILTEAYFMYKTALATFKAHTRAVKANRLAYAGVVKENNLGGRTVLDVLDAKEELLQAQIDQLEAKHQKVFYQFKLMAALGSLRTENLKNR